MSFGLHSLFGRHVAETAAALHLAKGRARFHRYGHEQSPAPAC